MKIFIETYYRFLATGILMLYTIANWYASTRLSITGDELGYFAYGVNMLKMHPEKECNAQGIPVFNSQLPVNAIQALPRAVQQVFNPMLRKDMNAVGADIRLGRLFSILSALLLGVYVLVWSAKLYGRSAGVFSLLLYVLCANLAAHSQLLGTDVFSFLLVTATCFHGWQFAARGKRRQLLYTALLLGAGQLTKQSLLLLYPVVALLWLLCMRGNGAQRIFHWCKAMLVVMGVSLLVINAGFLFSGTGKSLSKYKFASAQFQQLQQKWPVLGAIPLPLPVPFVQGFDYVRFNAETGPGIEGRSSYGDSYFLGKKTAGQKIWYYYLLCLAYKLPLPFLLLLSVALVRYFRRGMAYCLRQEALLLLTAGFILGMFCAFNTMYLGVRNVLMVLPLLFVFCGSLPALWHGRLCNWMLSLLLIWQVISVAYWYPHLLPYTNELLLNKKQVHTIFADSNIYFQEGGLFAQAYLRAHPEVQYEPAGSVKGKVMVSVEHYYDWWNQGTLQWLRDLRLQPVNHLHSGYLIFEIP